MTTGNDFRGAGWGFPVRVEGDEGRIALARLDQSIRESILLILGTAPGERAMRPTFGCGIHELVFGPNDATTASRIAHEVREALVEWEPRAEVLEVQATADRAETSKLLIHVRYRVRPTNTIFNIVYPFYLENSGN